MVPQEKGRDPAAGKSLFRVALVAGLSLSLSMGFFDVAWNLGRKGPPVFQTFTDLLPPLAATTLALFLLWGLTVLVGLLFAGLLQRREARPLICALTLFWAAVFILGSMNHLLILSYRLSMAIPATIVVLFSLLMAVNGYLLARSPRLALLERRSVKISVLAVPYLATGWLVSTWLHFYANDSWPAAGSAFFWLGLTVAGLGFVGFCAWRVDRIRPVRWLGVLMLAVLAAPFLARWAQVHPSSTSGHRVRHVILITVDTLRAQALSYIDGGEVTTPHIDSLARDSMVFHRAISPAPWTLPAFGSLLTGVSPAVHGAMAPFDAVPERLSTLAERMREAGYRTAAIGHNPFLQPKFQLSQGFQEYDLSPRLHLGSSFGSRLLGRLDPLHFRETAYTSDLTRLTIEWLRKNAKQDFFLWLHYFDPHDPYVPPEPFRPQGQPPKGLGWHFARAQDIRSGTFVPSLEQRAWIQALYEGEVRYVDEGVGKVVEALNRTHIYEEALVILASDHGEEFWEHGGYEHGHSLYDEVVNVPLLVKLPRSAGRGDVWETVSTGSITPWVLELCGIEHDPRDLSFSSSFLPVSAQEAPGLGQPVSSTGLLYFEDREAIFFGHWKYIRWLVTGREELYDLKVDPGEKHSLVSSSAKVLEEARLLSRELEEAAGAARAHHGLAPRDPEPIPKSRRDELKSLGYIQ